MDKRSSGKPVSAVLIEPTQQQTGYVASDDFLTQLRKVAHENEAALVVDETSTGCAASGKGFWQANSADADYVVFGKRTQVAGYFSKGNQFLVAGNHLDLARFQVVVDTVEKESLAENVDRVGSSMSNDLNRNNKSAKITGVRTSGNSAWIDTSSYQEAVNLQSHLRNQGVLVRLNGMRGVLTKPALTLNESQASEFASALGKF